MASQAKRRLLEQRIKEIDGELAALKKFRQTKQRDQFIRQLVGEQSYVKRQLSLLLSSSLKKDETKQEKQRRLSQQTSREASR